MTVRDFNTLVRVIDKTSRKKINKIIEDLNNTVNNLDLSDSYRATQSPLSPNTGSH